MVSSTGARRVVHPFVADHDREGFSPSDAPGAPAAAVVTSAAPEAEPGSRRGNQLQRVRSDLASLALSFAARRRHRVYVEIMDCRCR